ncbi:hypothetical protein DID75_04515 [Candidatus Marinamargulisbacteria bacterium SCGC AG-410-N11]|nr:hypothetical protein DID75_04515 [Candidatus Marinamargulisbacteria bacterium SCGC AG-410-N11]
MKKFIALQQLNVIPSNWINLLISSLIPNKEDVLSLKQLSLNTLIKSGKLFDELKKLQLNDFGSFNLSIEEIINNHNFYNIADSEIETILSTFSSVKEKVIDRAFTLLKHISLIPDLIEESNQIKMIMLVNEYQFFLEKFKLNDTQLNDNQTEQLSLLNNLYKHQNNKNIFLKLNNLKYHIKDLYNKAQFKDDNNKLIKVYDLPSLFKSSSYAGPTNGSRIIDNFIFSFDLVERLCSTKKIDEEKTSIHNRMALVVNNLIKPLIPYGYNPYILTKPNSDFFNLCYESRCAINYNIFYCKDDKKLSNLFDLTQKDLNLDSSIHFITYCLWRFKFYTTYDVMDQLHNKHVILSLMFNRNKYSKEFFKVKKNYVKALYWTNDPWEIMKKYGLSLDPLLKNGNNKVQLILESGVQSIDINNNREYLSTTLSSKEWLNELNKENAIQHVNNNQETPLHTLLNQLSQLYTKENYDYNKEFTDHSKSITKHLNILAQHPNAILTTIDNKGNSILHLYLKVYLTLITNNEWCPVIKGHPPEDDAAKLSWYPDFYSTSDKVYYDNYLDDTTFEDKNTTPAITFFERAIKQDSSIIKYKNHKLESILHFLVETTLSVLSVKQKSVFCSSNSDALVDKDSILREYKRIINKNLATEYNLKVTECMTLLDYLFEENSKIQFKKLTSVDINEKDIYGNSPLHWVVTNADLPPADLVETLFFKLLSKDKTALFLKNKFNKSPLDYILKNHNIDLLNKILETYDNQSLQYYIILQYIQNPYKHIAFNQQEVDILQDNDTHSNIDDIRSICYNDLDIKDNEFNTLFIEKLPLYTRYKLTQISKNQFKDTSFIDINKLILKLLKRKTFNSYQAMLTFSESVFDNDNNTLLHHLAMATDLPHLFYFDFFKSIHDTDPSLISNILPIKNKSNQCILKVAIQNRNINFFINLIKVFKGISKQLINFRDENNNNLIHLLFKDKESKKMGTLLKFFIDLKIDIYHPNINNETPLKYILTNLDSIEESEKTFLINFLASPKIKLKRKKVDKMSQTNFISIQEAGESSSEKTSSSETALKSVNHDGNNSETLSKVKPKSKSKSKLFNCFKLQQ